MTCSTCDGYQLVPNDSDGMLERCPDCLITTAVRCPAHGRSLRDGKCPDCGREAALAQDIIESRATPAGHPLVGAAA